MSLHHYIVKLRGIAEQYVYVEADSKSAARRKAVAGEWDDAQEIDFVPGAGLTAAREPVREPVQEIDSV